MSIIKHLFHLFINIKDLTRNKTAQLRHELMLRRIENIVRQTQRKR